MKKFNEKAVGLSLVIIGLIGLGMGLFFNKMPALSGPVLVKHNALSERSNDSRTSCLVLIVYDGDTLGCDMDQDGRIQRPHEEVRLLGIDSPEMHYSRKNPTHGSEHPVDEPFAKDASQWMERQTLRKTVYLEFDQRKYDRYGRALAFVYLGKQESISLNEQAVASGLATILFIGKNHLYEARFQQVEAEARTEKRGLWAGKG